MYFNYMCVNFYVDRKTLARPARKCTYFAPFSCFFFSSLIEVNFDKMTFLKLFSVLGDKDTHIVVHMAIGN